MEKDWSEIVPPSSTELISLNTKIPRNISERINVATGMLQTTNRLLVYTKQVTVQVLLERGLEVLEKEWRRQDQPDAEENENVVSMPRKKNTLADKVARGEPI